jgi:hypothetical protein
MAIASERTKDLYEEIPGYVKPPLATLPDPDDLSELERLGVRLGNIPRRLIKAAMFASGFRSFLAQLPNTVEELQRRCNTRGPVLFEPILSATMALEDDPRNPPPLVRAATLIAAVSRLHEDVMSGELPADQYRGQVLEMGQYPNFFATNVIVEGKKPRIFKSTNSSYIVVAVAGRFYKFDIRNADGGGGVQELADALARVADRARERRRQIDDTSPGLLTCGGHKAQLRAFGLLSRDPVNMRSLEVMKHNFFTLCLDLDDSPATHAEAARIAQSLNCGNRWYHSSLQVIVFGNAKACVVCNFNTYLDGNTMMRGAAELQRRAAECAVPTGERNGQGEVAEPVELTWRIDRRLAERAARDMRSVQDSQPATFTIDGVGKGFFTDRGLDPVPTFTLAVQVAVKRLTAQLPRVEQFLAVTRYRCMGLALADVTTPEVVSFVEYVAGGEYERDRARELLRDAADSQVDRCRRMRRALPLSGALSLFVNSRTGMQRVRLALVLLPTVLLLRLLGAFKVGSEVMLSHPAIYREIPVVGRPGIRLPYVKYFALHYQVVAANTILTLMPGVRWSVPNSEIVAVLCRSLDEIRSIAEGKSPRSAEGFVQGDAVELHRVADKGPIPSYGR